MGQTILCEVIAAWEETGEQPNFSEFGFDSILDALKAAQDTMFELGTSYNRLRERYDSQQSAQQHTQPTVLTWRDEVIMCPECKHLFTIHIANPHSR